MCALEITATYIPSLIPVKAYQRRVLVYEQYPKNFRIRNILYFKLVFQHKAPKLVQINFKITLGVY